MSRREYLIVGLLAVLSLLILSISIWYIQRDIHYSFSYGRMVNRDIDAHLAPLNKRLGRIEETLYQLEQNN
jgi:hypothetical protein